ncbi:MAG: glucosamine-6-phosphate isomerase [Candidatus Cloacimonadota bacterium]|nr:MAG: glucosamine-6-phosphate isomerase [Candidatus Cloacimonadota bacterium]PIE77936.1 MAG: glucosamine-6-phosphate isomerase [Candidatus Delongbacteria bacterium]
MSKIDRLTKVERSFFELSNAQKISAKIPYIMVDNFPKLGLLTSLRFLEWSAKNPNGVISLPTGKTPEHFIKWSKHILLNWNDSKVKDLREKYNLDIGRPDLSNLHFVQIDEFFPISSKQVNSFNYYVNKFYIEGFGLDKRKALLINSDKIPLHNDLHFSEVFPDSTIDLSLRFREAKSYEEEIQQKSIFMIDKWCSEYEAKIRELGGIGFFLGGIGPDGHIAFNTRGSDHYSTTRLTTTNFETQAVAASDLGGIEVSRNRLVITIGLETISYKPDATAIIIAAGEAKAQVVKNSLESEPNNLYPATVLHKLKNARFYTTESAASALQDSIDYYYEKGEWTHLKTERAVIDLCKKLNKYGHHLTLDDLKNDRYCRLIPNLGEDTIRSVIESIKKKFLRKLNHEKNQVYYHTGPHHDDIMLGMLPHINRQLRDKSSEFHFSVLTSGFTAVTNRFVINILEKTISLIDENRIQMIKYHDFFETGYKQKWDKDISHYLNNVAEMNEPERERGLCHRVVRIMVEIFNLNSKDDLINTINSIISELKNSYDGEKNPPKIQKLKGMIREFEEELVWTHSGVNTEHIHHLRLGFYKGDIFSEQPERSRDVLPILEQLRRIKPTVISLALDPEGSGPDTHYKVLQAIAEAIRMWSKEEDLSNLKIWGYRNVWYRFHPAEANVIIPVSLNSLAVLDSAFTSCYMTQVNASFPSYMLDGKFSTLAQKIWVEQLKELQLLLGKDYFYLNENVRIRTGHGILLFKEMDIDDFLKHARRLERSMEGIEL